LRKQRNIVDAVYREAIEVC